VLAYFVAERRVEPGIGLALGAERSTMVAMVLRQRTVLALSGIAIGMVLALAMSKLISSLLYNVTAHAVWAFLVAPLAFLSIALVASYLPARRTMEVDPVEALRGN
jgi:putative ABC transport system permease protein